MKWNTKDYKGNPATWYSADAINKIESICRQHVCDYDTCVSDDCECLPKEILDIIESEN